jgi:hypothetical protein
VLGSTPTRFRQALSLRGLSYELTPLQSLTPIE